MLMQQFTLVAAHPRADSHQNPDTGPVMTVSVARGAISRIGPSSSFVLQVKVPNDRAQQAAEAALQRLAAGEPRGPAVVPLISDVVRLPGGPFVHVKGGDASRKKVTGLLGLVCELLQHEDLAGPADGSLVTVPEYEKDNLAAHAHTLRDPIAMLALPPAESGGFGEGFPDIWVDIATRWVLGGDNDADVDALLSPSTLTLPGAMVSEVLFKVGDYTTVRLARRISPSSVRVADFGRIGPPRLILATGILASGDDDRELDRDSSELVGALEELAGEGMLGFVTLEDDLKGIDLAYVHDPRPVDGFRPISPGWIIFVCERALFDAFPVQVLGPGHMGRLKLDRNWIRPVPRADSTTSRRYMLTSPEPLTYWRPTDPHYAATVGRCRRILQPCFPTIEQVQAGAGW